ncbi:hypothetical protein DFH06DRAFT_1374813 [Mycena polygramma]|nr:hypothetical protein DFH06DRAFT_1374813 [Mycena polygramma]
MCDQAINRGVMSQIELSRTGEKTWSTLLTPVAIIVSTPLVGSEIDLSGPILRQMWDDAAHQRFNATGAGPVQYCVSTTAANPTLYTLEPESGYAAVSAALGQASTVMLIDQALNISTSMAIQLDLQLPMNDRHRWYLPSCSKFHRRQEVVNERLLYSINYPRCWAASQKRDAFHDSTSFKNLTNNTTPSLTLTTETFQESALPYGVIYTQLSSTCEAESLNSNEALTYANEYVMAIGCKPDDYISPRITRVNVDYTPVINAKVDLNGEVILDPDGPTAFVAMSNLLLGIYWGQGVVNNALGDRLMAMQTDSWTPEDVLKPLTRCEPQEAYIQGAMEYTGSCSHWTDSAVKQLFRGCLMANSALGGHGGVPLNMSIATSGVFYTDTLGWTYASGTTRWILIPGTVIALATIAIVVVAIYRHAGNLPRDADRFDPSNPLHLIAAAAAGGLNNSFRGFSGKDMKEGEKLNVVLGSIPGRGPALVRQALQSPDSAAFSVELQESAYTPNAEASSHHSIMISDRQPAPEALCPMKINASHITWRFRMVQRNIFCKAVPR